MARIRTIKPEFPQSESMGRVSRDARLLFVMLWTICDDEGRARGNSRMLASLLFPYDDDARNLLDGWMGELESEGCVVRFQVENDTYLEISNWQKHQKIDKPSRSKIPAFDESSRILANPREVSSEDQGSKDQGSKDHSPLPPKGESVRATRQRRTRTQILEPFGSVVIRVVNTLLDEWRLEDPKDGRKITVSPEDTGKAVDAILKTQPNVTGDMLVQAGRNYLASTRERYKAPQYFFGPEGPWDGFVKAILTAQEAPLAS